MWKNNIIRYIYVYAFWLNMRAYWYMIMLRFKFCNIFQKKKFAARFPGPPVIQKRNLEYWTISGRNLHDRIMFLLSIRNTKKCDVHFQLKFQWGHLNPLRFWHEVLFIRVTYQRETFCLRLFCAALFQLSPHFILDKRDKEEKPKISLRP